jgi:hypothetical protein
VAFSFASLQDFNKDGSVSKNEKMVFWGMLGLLFFFIWKGRKKAKQAYGAGMRRTRSTYRRTRGAYRTRRKKWFK